MAALTQPFRQRASDAIQKAVRQRVFLIGNRADKNFITQNDCLKVLQDISTLQSDRQYAMYLVANFDLVLFMPSGRNRSLKATISNLRHEAQSILYNPKPKQQTTITL